MKAMDCVRLAQLHPELSSTGSGSYNILRNSQMFLLYQINLKKILIEYDIFSFVKRELFLVKFTRE